MSDSPSSPANKAVRCVHHWVLMLLSTGVDRCIAVLILIATDLPFSPGNSTPRGFAKVVNAIQFADLLDVETILGLNIANGDDKDKAEINGPNDNFSTKDGGKTWQFKYKIQVKKLRPPTLERRERNGTGKKYRISGG